MIGWMQDSMARRAGLLPPLHISQELHHHPACLLHVTPSRTEEHRKHVLLFPGFVQISIGIVGLVVLHCELGDVFVPYMISACWLVGSGLIALCSTCCTTRIFILLTGVDTTSLKYQQLSLFFLHVYQSIVLAGVLVNFSSAMYGIQVFSTRPSGGRFLYSRKPGFCVEKSMLGTAEAGIATFLAGVVLCFLQLMVAVTIQKTLGRRFSAYKTAKRDRLRERTRIAEAHAAAHHLLLHGATAAHSSGDMPDRNEETSSLLVMPEDLPPRYSSVGLPLADQPPPSFSRRGTLESVPESLPPSYSEIQMANCIRT